MPVQWKRTKHQGVRYYEHGTRKHGVNLDRYFAIRYMVNGKRKEEGLGFASQGWTADKAALELAALKKAHTLGEGPASLEEKRTLKKELDAKKRQERTAREKEGLTFGEFFTKTYYTISKTSKKSSSYRKENELFKNWLKPVLGNTPLSKITAFNIEKVKKAMLDAGKATRTIQYCFAVFRQCWNMARNGGLVVNDSPTKQARLPKIDNRRMRFLTHEEAGIILNDLRVRSITVYNMALLSLKTGMRFGEMASLKWQNIDLDRGLIAIVDAKGGTSRTAYMTGDIKKMFEGLPRAGKEAFVFLNSRGEKFEDTPQTFRDSVKDLKLNENITDKRQKICFHTLRHTFASWLVEAGTDLYTVKELMGHSTLAMTERYSHLGANTLQIAVKHFDQSMARATEAGKIKEAQEQKGQP